MCNYSDYVFDKGKLEGLAEGKLEGLAEGKPEGLAEGTVKTIITLLKKAGASDESIVKEIMEQLSVPYDEAVHLMKTYTPNDMK